RRAVPDTGRADPRGPGIQHQSAELQRAEGQLSGPAVWHRADGKAKRESLSVFLLHRTGFLMRQQYGHAVSPSQRAGGNACPTLVRRAFATVGGAGAFACANLASSSFSPARIFVLCVLIAVAQAAVLD